MIKQLYIVKRNRFYYSGFIWLVLCLILFVVAYLTDIGVIYVSRWFLLIASLIMVALFALRKLLYNEYDTIGSLKICNDQFIISGNEYKLNIPYCKGTKIFFNYHNYAGEYMTFRILFYGDKICDGADNVLKISNSCGTSRFNVLLKSDDQRKELEKYLLSLKENYNINVEIRHSISRILKVF